jgi:hypothetical protein
MGDRDWSLFGIAGASSSLPGQGELQAGCTF